MKVLADKMTNKWVPALKVLAPDAGAYMSEVRNLIHILLAFLACTDYVKADPQQPNWQQAFYSSNYQALRKIKHEYDPFETFYAPTAVGSEAWVEADNGALCRAI